MEGETQPMGFRARIREILSKESTAIVPITERNLPRFDETLTKLSGLAKSEDGMLNINLKPEESNAEWANSVKALWVFGVKEANLALPDQALGFVNAYAPEHMDEINKMLVATHRRPFDTGAVVEMASYAKDYPANIEADVSATKQALAKVFMDDGFKDVRAVTVWVTHEKDNALDPKQQEVMQNLGAIKLGALKYAPDESVDSTCFIIHRNAFMNRLTETTSTR